MKSVKKAIPKKITTKHGNLKFDKDVKECFLEAYIRLNFSVREACRFTKISLVTFYAHLQDDLDFKKDFDKINKTASNAVKHTILEALNHTDWSLKKWAVDTILKRNKLFLKADISDLEEESSSLTFQLSKNDFIK